MLWSTLCKLFSHKYDEWIYVSSNVCDQTATCKRCGNIWRRKNHHVWAEWKYLVPESCEQERLCTRCGTKDQLITKHSWNEWAYITPDSCKQSRVCSRCKQEEHRLKHRKLRNNGTEAQSMGFDYSSYMEEFADVTEYECLACGEKTYETGDVYQGQRTDLG